ncbi:MAG TPA: hypothetical protein VNN21_09295 [Dehalococcoidia bacterium]|nr:hypothetical protein [Dehalococcoidia bacterium]
MKSLILFAAGVCTGGIMSALAGEADASGTIIGVFAALGFYAVIAGLYVWGRRLWYQAIQLLTSHLHHTGGSPGGRPV